MSFREENQRLRESGLYRELRRIDSAQGPRVLYKRREYILLASNNYLDLARHPQVIEAAREAAQQYGVGAGASRLISGNMSLHERLEEAIAWLKGTETALLFNTGYMANTGVLSVFAGRGDAIYLDRLCHASLVDGAILSRAKVLRFRHNDIEHLTSLLARPSPFKRRLIVSEGVFSMDGDIAPLPELVAAAERYDALLYIDDAHATGVIGKTGRGTAEHFGLDSQRIPVIMGTLGKALGGFGAFVSGSIDLRHHLINHARTFIYSTALPPPAVAAAFTAIKILKEQPHLVESLQANRRYFHQGLTTLGFRTLATETPIIPVLIGDVETAVSFSARLLDEGVFAPAIRPPTVPQGSSRIRTTVMASHTQEDLDFCLTAFQKVGKELRII